MQLSTDRQIKTVDDLIANRPGFENMETAQQDQAIAINDFIYMSQGTSNSYMVLTTQGRVIINTGLGFEALTHKQVFDAVHPGPTPYILLTQGHVDHLGGVGQFRESGTQLVAQANNASCQHDDARIRDIRISQAFIWFQKTLEKGLALAEEHPEVFVQDEPVPDILFEDSYQFTLGGMEFELLACPGGETVDSCVVWLPQHKILFSGNTFGPLFPHFPNINTVRGDKYRYLNPYLDTLARIRSLEPDIMITGHFEPIVGKALIRESLSRLEGAVQYVHSETLKGMNAGVDIYTLMRDIRIPEQYRVGEGYGKISWAVRTIWESYMGWFKAQSTTELYPTQSRDIYAELAELAGIERVVNLGSSKLTVDNPEAALHLAEVALAKDPLHKDALQLALNTHYALLDRSKSTNFWETGWLKYQIEQLEQRINSSS